MLWGKRLGHGMYGEVVALLGKGRGIGHNFIGN